MPRHCSRSGPVSGPLLHRKCRGNGTGGNGVLPLHATSGKVTTLDAEQRESQTDAEDASKLEYRPDEPMICYNCGTELPDDRRHCPGCGRSLFRTCYCGASIPVTYKTCPNCGANWSQSARARKRRSKSRTVKPARMALYAVSGAVAAILLYGVARAVITSMARGSLAPGEMMPAGDGARLVLSAQTLLTAFGRVGAFMAGHSTSLLGLLLIIVIGAVGGTVYYVITTKADRNKRNHRSVPRRDSSVRRRRA